jgi:hypothetical protein
MRVSANDFDMRKGILGKEYGEILACDATEAGREVRLDMGRDV